jgi:hypothetical protein
MSSTPADSKVRRTGAIIRVLNGSAGIFRISFGERRVGEIGRCWPEAAWQRRLCQAAVARWSISNREPALDGRTLRYRNEAFRVPKTKRNNRSKKYSKSNALPQSYRLLTGLVGDLPFNNHSGLKSGS